jgi:hypothetical protein
MSATWSLTYLQTSISERELFEVVAKLFALELNGELYGIERDHDPYLPITFVKLKNAIVEWFDDPTRAKMIFDALLGDRYGSGVLIYPQKNGLLTIADSVLYTNDIDSSGRTRRTELIAENPDPQFYSLFKYMGFLRQLTENLAGEAAHLMYERNPAGHVTGIPFYKAGQLVDEYFAEQVDADPAYENMIDLPQHPEVLREILGGRFAFLLDQPKRWPYPINSNDEEDYDDVYFQGEHIGMHLAEWDIFNLRQSDLYVPFWDEHMLPLGAVYCLNGELPDYFLKRHEQS